MKTVTDIAALRLATGALREGESAHSKQGQYRLALVPTMGALHDGHLALVRAAQQRAAHVVVSIFVNPMQFGAGEDLDAYPRQLARDQDLLKDAGVDLLWAPHVAAIYPNGFQTVISTPEAAKGLCGAKRPGHFDGVATIVCKLLNQVQPDIALFGEKDYQQLCVIKTMVRDLDMTVGIKGVPTVREADGLAMSSRNAYLTAEQRSAAAILPNAMKAAIADIESASPVAPALAQLQSALTKAGFHAIDYAELRMADTLAEPDYTDLEHGAQLRLLVAARIGKTRLIDNMAVHWPKF